MTKNNLIQCVRCKQNLIREEWDSHVCRTGFKGIRNIDVLQWWETKGNNGERVAFGLGSDGYTYKLSEIEKRFVEIDIQTSKLNTKKNYDSNPDNLPVLQK